LSFSSEMSFCSCAVRAPHFDTIVPAVTQLGRPDVCLLKRLTLFGPQSYKGQCYILLA